MGSSPCNIVMPKPLRIPVLLVCVLGMLGSGALVLPSSAQTPAPQLDFNEALTRLSLPYLEHRSTVMSSIRSPAQARARQAHVRETLLHLIGGLPEERGPLNATIVGTTQKEGYRIERIVYDSVPGYHVTANLYVPTTGKGPYPAVIYHAGHGPMGKAEAYGLAQALAANGIATFAYDPLGAGERLQAMNPATGKSWAGPDEHSQANIPMSLIGDNVSRYMVWDAMRGIDYVQTRSDIDSHQFGSYGCSGGGTLSAYLTALDPRVKAGVVACYLTSYTELLKTIGPQDGEQVLPGFIKAGLDFPDLIELAAPRAYAMVSTTEDMFPFSGAKTTYEEATSFYSLLGKREPKWFTGPGRHGAIRPLMPQIVAFFMSELAGNTGTPITVTAQAPARTETQCTTTGQVATSLPGRTIYEVTRDRARILTAGRKTDKKQLRRDVTTLNSIDLTARSIPSVSIQSTEQHPGYTLQVGFIADEAGMSLPMALALPEAPGRKPVFFISSARPLAELTAAGSEFERAAQSGKIAIAITPMPWPASPDAERPTMGTALPWTSRALLIGKTFVGMRTEDMLATVRWLCARNDVDSHSIRVVGEGPQGVVVLHATVLEPRITSITVRKSLISYQSVIDVPVHRGVSELVIPGVLLHYDLADLEAVLPRGALHIEDPVDGSGAPVVGALAVPAPSVPIEKR